MSKGFDDLTSWLDDGISLKNREIHLDAEVDNETMGKIFRAVKEMQSRSDAPISLYISSYGGDIYHAFSLYDLLSDFEGLVYTYGSGPIMSAGLLLFLVGDVRDMSENSRIMAHSVSEHSFFESRKTSEIENDLAAQKDIEEAMVAVLAEKTVRSKQWWNKTIKHQDVYINREKAIKLGILTVKE
jgi:ATP-dependent Clp protease protease subunit